MKCDPSVALRADVIYRAPSGRLCRWVPSSDTRKPITSYATFEYLRRGGEAGHRHGAATRWEDQFCLTPANYQLLRVGGAR